MAVIIQGREENDSNDSRTARLSLLVTGVSDGTASTCRQQLDTAGYTLGSSYSGYITGITLSSLNYTPVEDSGGKTWTATATYGNDSSSETVASFVKIESSTRVEAVDIWRTGAAFPGYPQTPGLTDISGTKVDSAGSPVSGLLVQQELNYTVRVSNFSSANQATVNSMIGTRNDNSTADFLGGNPGFVLFTGCRRSRISVDVYEVTYTFIWDAAAHLRQAPKRTVDGEPQLVKIGDDYFAEVVYARQPFPNVSNFNALPGI